MNKEKLNEGFEAVKAFFSSKDVQVDIKVKEESKLIKFANDRENEENKLDKFEDLVLNGGGMVMIEPEVEAGAAIAIQVDETWVPAPPSEYQLEDGRVVTVVEDGIIDSVVEAEGGEAETVEEAPIVEEEMESEQSVKRVIESIVKEKIFSKSEEVEELTKKLDFALESIEKLTAEKSEVLDKFEALSKFSEEQFKNLYSEPVNKPVVKNKNPLKGEPKTSVFGLKNK